MTWFDPRKLRARGRAPVPARARASASTTPCSTSRAAARPCCRRLRCALAGRHPHNARRLLNAILDTHLLGRLLGTRLVGAEHTLVGSETVRRLHDQGIAIGTHTLFPLGSTTGKPIAPSACTAGRGRAPRRARRRLDRDRRSRAPAEADRLAWYQGPGGAWNRTSRRRCSCRSRSA